MRVQNDQNKRKVQLKYQQFKAAQLQNSNVKTTPLVIKDQNVQQKNSGQIASNDKFQCLLKSMPKNDKVFQIMMSDPSIYEMSQNLKKQAEQKNLNTIISSFPHRYQSLLESQAKLKIMQKHSKQREQKQYKQIQILMEKLFASENKVKQQNTNIQQIKTNIRNKKQLNYMQYCQQIKRKQTIIYDLTDQVQEMERKYNKLKQDHRHSHQVILQLREHEQQHTKETQRLVDKLNQAQQKIIKAHKRILQYENQKRIQTQHHHKIYQQKIQQLQKNIIHLNQLLIQANIRVQYKQSLLVLSQNEHEQISHKLQNQLCQKHSQIQKLRQQHLQALQSIDQLQQRINRQQEQKVRSQQIRAIEKEQMRKCLQKCYHENAESKGQVQAKNQLIKMLQKSLQCLKISYQSDISTKNNEWIQQNRQINKLKSQLQKQLQNTEKNKKYQQQLCTQIQKIQTQQVKLELQLQQNQTIFKKYLYRISEQQQLCCKLEKQMLDWLSLNGVQNQKNQVIVNKYAQLVKLQERTQIFQYQNMIQKMREQITRLTKQSQNNYRKQSKIVKQLIQQNKILKIQLKQQKIAQLKKYYLH